MNNNFQLIKKHNFRSDGPCQYGNLFNILLSGLPGYITHKGNQKYMYNPLEEVTEGKGTHEVTHSGLQY